MSDLSVSTPTDTVTPPAQYPLVLSVDCINEFGHGYPDLFVLPWSQDANDRIADLAAAVRRVDAISISDSLTQGFWAVNPFDDQEELDSFLSSHSAEEVCQLLGSHKSEVEFPFMEVSSDSFYVSACPTGRGEDFQLNSASVSIAELREWQSGATQSATIG